MDRRLGGAAQGTGRFEARLPVICLTLICVVVVGCIVAGAVVRPGMYSDAGWGLLGWDSRGRASAFNHSASLDHSDISRELDGFMSMWAPGQHLIPGMVESAGLDLGLAIILVTSAFSVLGLIGWYVVYSGFGFPLLTTLIALAVIACSRFFNLSFTIYTGGELLLFGAAPWFLALAWKLRDLRWTALPPLLAGAAVLTFMKLTGIAVAAAAVGSAAACGDRAWRRHETIRKLSIAGLTIALMGGLFYWAWLSRGPTPSSIPGTTHPHGLVFYVAFAISSMWSAALSLGDLGAYLFLNPARPLLSSNDAIAYALLPGALVVFAVTYVRLRDGYGEYLRFAFLFSAAMSAFLIVNWMAGKSVSFDERHFRIASLLVLVGTVHAFVGLPSRFGRALFVVVVGVSMAYGLASFVKRVEQNRHEALGSRGFRLNNTPREVVDFIRTIDVPGPEAPRTLVFLPSPEIALEVRHARSWSNHADFQELDELRKETYRGRVDRLYVIMQKRLIALGKADVILRSFVDYPIGGWTMVPLGDFVCFYQTGS